MKTILDIVNRRETPEPWSEGDNIPWNDPEFSERMLAEHLSQEHDLASRREETIDQQVEWVFTELLGSRPARVLDLACGPGLYALRLARRGCTCCGIDFSPASIRHARDAASAAGERACFFEHADVRQASFGEGFDLVMMIYGQFNVFRRDQGADILRRAHAALKPGGSLLLEIQGEDLIRTTGAAGPSWYSARSGLFSEHPHVVLQENFWDEGAAASTTRFMVIEAQGGRVSRFALSNEAYTDAELDDVLRAAGFGGVTRYPSLGGSTAAESQGLVAIRARK